MKREALVPIDEQLRQAIADQQACDWRFIWPLVGTLNGTVFKHQFECRARGR